MSTPHNQKPFGFSLGAGLIFCIVTTIISNFILDFTLASIGRGLCAGVLGFVGAWDLKTHRIPNVVTLGMLPIIFFISPLFTTNIFQLFDHVYISPLAGGIAALAIFGFTYLLTKSNLGGGDVKLAALIGVISGFPGVLISIGVGLILAVSVNSVRKMVFDHIVTQFPLGPYLSAGAILYLCFIPIIS